MGDGVIQGGKASVGMEEVAIAGLKAEDGGILDELDGPTSIEVTSGGTVGERRDNDFILSTMIQKGVAKGGRAVAMKPLAAERGQQ